MSIIYNEETGMGAGNILINNAPSVVFFLSSFFAWIEWRIDDDDDCMYLFFSYKNLNEHLKINQNIDNYKNIICKERLGLWIWMTLLMCQSSLSYREKQIN